MSGFEANKIPGGYIVTGRVTGRARGEYVLIMDTSGSMGAHACNILTTVGKTVARVGAPIDIITFSDRVQKHKGITADKFPMICAQYVRLGGSTKMAPAIGMLAEYANREFTTIVVISDGELHDRNETMAACERMRGTFARGNASVFAIRLHTSTSSPETLGLAGLMVMGNVHSSELIDVNASTDYHDVLSAQLESIMTMPCVRILSTEERLAHTQTSIGVKSIVTAGVFYIQGGAIPPIWIGGRPVDIEVASQSIGVYLDRIATDIESRMRLARVTGNKQECEAILAHIRLAEAELTREQDTADDALGASRVRRAILENQRRLKGISGRLAEIANNDRVSAMNAQQCADYLRTTANTRLARATASRQMTDDITTAIIAELRNLSRHVDKMPREDIDADTSVISQLSTAEAFRDIFANIDDIGSLNAAQILELIGIVGMAACGRAGDYPDPMCYKLDGGTPTTIGTNVTTATGTNPNRALYTHTLYSCGDLMQAWRWAAEHNGDPPRAVGGGEITAVIPLMSAEMQDWIMRYSRDPPLDASCRCNTPIMLEAMAGISMRRMIGAVPQTYLYLLVAGYWELLLAEPTELVVKSLAQIRALLDPFRSYWDHVRPVFTGRMCWIGNNGLSNMLVFAREDDPLISHIVHSAFSFDAYQLVRKRTRPETTGMTRDEFAARIICGKPEGADDLDTYSSDIIRWNITTLEWQMRPNADRWIKHPYWQNAVGICKRFGVTLDTCQQFGYLIQSFKYWEKKLRVIDNAHPFNELSDAVAARAQVTEILAVYAEGIRAAQKKERKTAALAAALTTLIMQAIAADRTQFCKLLAEGLTTPWEGEQLHVMLTPMNIGPVIEAIECGDKLKIIITGKYNGQTYWNNGNVIRRHGAFRKFKANAEFAQMMRDVVGSNHVYRDSPNRHGHSNEKPSYYAYGFDRIEDYRASITEAEWRDYCREHVGCCGL